MIRKLTILAAAVAMLFVVAPSQDAQAQSCRPGYNGAILNSAGECVVIEYNPFTPTATPIPRPTAAPTSSAEVSADTVAATTGDGAGAGGGASIAFTGSESRVLGYAGAGLIGFGALALVAARRRSETEEN